MVTRWLGLPVLFLWAGIGMGFSSGVQSGHKQADAQLLQKTGMDLPTWQHVHDDWDKRFQAELKKLKEK